MLEITDDEGNIFSAKIENCGNVQMHEEVSLVYPFLNYNVFFHLQIQALILQMRKLSPRES